MSSSNTFKIILLGDSGVGKTTFINRHLCGEFNNTDVKENTTLSFMTNVGKVTFEISDNNNPNDKYDASILMFDVANKSSYDNLKHLLIKNLLTVVCGNKVDLRDREVKPRDIFFHIKHNLQYYDLSVKSNYNYDKPFIYLCKQLVPGFIEWVYEPISDNDEPNVDE